MIYHKKGQWPIICYFYIGKEQANHTRNTMNLSEYNLGLTKITVTLLIIGFAVLQMSCSDDGKPVPQKDLIGFDLIDHLDESNNFRAVLVFEDDIISAIKFEGTDSTYRAYSYDNEKRLLKRACSDSCNTGSYSYGDDLVIKIDDRTVTYDGDSIFDDGKFAALINNGNIVQDSIFDIVHNEVRIPTGFRHFYAIFWDRHFPIHQDRSLKREETSIDDDSIRYRYLYTFDDDGRVETMTQQRLKNGVFINIVSHLYRYK